MTGEWELLRPWWLLAVLPVCWLLFRGWSFSLSPGDWHKYVDPALRPHVLEGSTDSRSRWPLFVGALVWLVAIVVLVGPVWEQRPLPALKAANSQVIALDVSRSMDTDDRKPTRLARAKFKLQDLLAGSPGTETGLLLFSEVAYIVSPLTDDIGTIEAFLPAIDTSVVPVQGSRLAPAIDKSLDLLQQAGRADGSIVLLTDALSDARAERAARQARDAGFSVSVLALATEAGAPIRLADGSLLEDANGTIAVTRLDRPGLSNLAAAGGGIYVELAVDNTDIEKLQSVLSQQGVGAAEQSGIGLVQWIEQAPWLLLPLLVLSSLVFRRGVFS